MMSSPFGPFLIDTRKSIVLNSGGFHLNEWTHVTFVFLTVSFSVSNPTPLSIGVKINPSVLYSNNSSRCFCKIVLHP